MRTIAFVRSMMLGPVMLVPLVLAAPIVSSAQVTVAITVGPPELPVYEQPECPAANYIWAPGYWNYGSDDYFWVPGTWVMVPAPGLLWTPGYWS